MKSRNTVIALIALEGIIIGPAYWDLGGG